jgi:hypothetical protein
MEFSTKWFISVHNYPIIRSKYFNVSEILMKVKIFHCRSRASWWWIILFSIQHLFWGEQHSIKKSVWCNNTKWYIFTAFFLEVYKPQHDYETHFNAFPRRRYYKCQSSEKSILLSRLCESGFCSAKHTRDRRTAPSKSCLFRQGNYIRMVINPNNFLYLNVG